MEKARHAQAEFELTEKNQELLAKIDEAHKQGAKERAESLADAALLGKMRKYWAIAILFVLAFLFIGIVLVMKLANGELSWLPEAYEKSSAVIDALIEISIGIIGFLVISKSLCGLDRNAVRERLIEKYMK